MQKRALKQLGKVTQWTNEKVFSGEKTQLSSEFTEFERDIDVKRKGIERLHATSSYFFDQITKVKPTSDPYPPPGSGKEKTSATEALGLVMIDYGGELGDAYGDGLNKYGRARCKLAMAQEEFGNRLRENYMADMETSLGAVNEYKAYRKKLDSRRLALDAAITKLKGAKKDHATLENEVDLARERFEEIEAETSGRMEVLQSGDEVHFADLTDLLEAELEYFSKCKDILEELRDQWPAYPTGAQYSNSRPRANTATSARSTGSRGAARTTRQLDLSDDEDEVTNRNRSQSNASSTGKVKGGRGMLSSLGRSALSGLAQKRKSGFVGNTYNDEERLQLHSDDGGDEYGDYPTYGESRRREDPPSPRAAFSANGRARSTSTLSSSHWSTHSDSTTGPPPSMRRTYTSPPATGVRYVKALFPFAGGNSDELSLVKGMIIEVKSEVSADWWIGEADGHGGMFPSSYVEEYVPTPTTALAPSMPARRTLPPSSGAPPRNVPAPSRRDDSMPPSPVMDYHTMSDSEHSIGYDDADHHTAAGLTSMAQPAGSSSTTPANRSRSSTMSKKPPPPPPSRRSQSSQNILQSALAPTKAPKPVRSRAATLNSTTGRAAASASREESPEGSPFIGSPFAGSGDESDTPAPPGVPAPRGAAGGLSHGLGAMHIRGSASASDSDASIHGDCASCGCADFTQNVFKAKGICSTCFHAH